MWARDALEERLKIWGNLPIQKVHLHSIRIADIALIFCFNFFLLLYLFFTGGSGEGNRTIVGSPFDFGCDGL